MTALTFPPLMRGEAATVPALEHAAQRAVLGCDSGLVVHRIAAHRAEAALVFAPEIPLREAMAMLPLCGVGFQNALGALAPPEVAVHLTWTGGLRVNGAACGHMAVRASGTDPDAVPDWLVVGWSLALIPDAEGGHDPDRTALYAEGCADVGPGTLVEAWARHSLNWIARWEAEGVRPLAEEWRGLVHGIGETATRGGRTGTFLGVDEAFGMLLRDEAGATHLIPLATLLEDAP